MAYTLATLVPHCQGPDDETKEYLSSSGWGSFFTDTLQGSSKDETDSAVKETLDKHDANLHSSTTTETKIGQRREEVNQPDATSTDISTLDCSEGSERTSLNTMWGHIIKKYACIAVPSLQHLTGNDVKEIEIVEICILVFFYKSIGNNY